MESKELYRAMVIGPTGSGKSQFCNFIQRDRTNSINKVSDSLDSCTKDPNSNIFTRKQIKYEFIDTAGNSDSSNDDIKNLKLLIDFIKKKESIDYIPLLLKFNERVTNDTRAYLESLGKIFTAKEFYTHLCVFFTKFPSRPSKKDNRIKEKSICEINNILKEIFKIEENMPIPDVNVYFIDTEIDEDDQTYDEKSQETIDIMMEQMKLDVMKYGSINTKTFDITGENCKLRKENEKKIIEDLKKKIEEEKLKKEKEEKEKRKMQEEIKKLKEDNELRKNIEEELKKLLDKEEEEKQKCEEFLKNVQEMEQRNLEKKREIEEKARKRGIEIEKLNGKIDKNLSTTKNMLETGVATSSGAFTLLFLIQGLGTSVAVETVSNILAFSVLSGLGVTGLATIPLLFACGYKLKKWFT